MMLLRLITWPYIRKHVLRTVLTVAGIALGVTVFVGMNSANTSVRLAFSRTVDRIAGKTELQVTAGETGFPEDVLDRVQSAPGVRVAVPVIEAAVATSLRGGSSLLVLGIDFMGDRSLRDYDLESGEDAVIDDPLVFLAQPDSIIVSRAFAETHGLAASSRLRLGTVEGEKPFTVRGIMRAGGLASAFGGNIAVMDIYAAQKMFGRGRMFDRIDLALTPGRGLADGIAELQSILGPGFDVAPPSGRGRQFEAMIASYSVMMGASSLFALFIGMFIIYNAFAIAVTERRSEIGILRALGATRREIRWLFLGEGIITGIVGSAVGVMAGLAIASGIASSVSTLVSDSFGVAREAGDIALSGALIASAFGIGVATSLVAAWIPARAAARVEPVVALHKGKAHALSGRESRLRVILAAMCAAASGGCLVAGSIRAVFYASYLCMIAALLLLTPLLSVWLARLIRPVLQWMRPVEGALAADSLIHTPRRTSATVAALMLSLALVIAFAGMARASYGSIREWTETALNPDMFVMPSPQIATRTIRFPAAMTAELQAVPGIRRLQEIRNPRVMFRGTPVMLLAIDLSSVEELTPVRMIAGAPDMFRAAAAGHGALVSDTLAQLRGLRLGETLDLVTPSGVVRLPLVGIIVDYSDPQGAIIVDQSVFRQHWRDETVNFYRVYLESGTQVADVQRRLLERFAGERQVFVMTTDELKAYILGIAGQWFGLTYVQVAVAVLVAVLGIVNTLTVSITDRRRELGIVRAVGGLGRQVKRTIWMEAVTTAFLGIVLGSALGALNLYYLLEIVRRDVAGMQLEYQYPVAVALGVAPVVLGAAFLAAIWPSARAVRGSLVEALEYE